MARLGYARLGYETAPANLSTYSRSRQLTWRTYLSDGEHRGGVLSALCVRVQQDTLIGCGFVLFCFSPRWPAGLCLAPGIRVFLERCGGTTARAGLYNVRNILFH